MNSFQFVRLIRSIYRRGGPPPDLDWIESLGLLAVKIGQVHALRIDFLDRDKCETLARLYRRNTSIPAEDFLALLERQATSALLEAIDDFDPGPLASASVGQVHRGRLKTGESVVIKAIKPGRREKFQSDVARVRRLFRLMAFVYPRLKGVGNPVAILDDIEQYTMSELDLRNEVEGQRRLHAIQQQATRFDLSRLRFAAIHESLSNENVLVSDFVEGPSFDELLEQGRLDYDLLLELFRVHGFYMFCVGEFHGDMHPGNVLLDGQSLCFVDTGYVATVSPGLRRGLFEFFSALSAYDYPACAAALNRMSEKQLSGSALAEFERGFIALYADFDGASVSDVSLTRKMMQTIRFGVQSGMSFEKGIFAIIRSLMYLDGMVLRCNPDAVLLRDMRPFIGEFERFV